MFSHVDGENKPGMVDVGGKTATRRSAHARSVVHLPAGILDALDGGELKSKKGPVFQTAVIAGTMAVKRTSELIPFCHPLGIEQCAITIAAEPPERVVIDCRVSVEGKTGVEMEALTGASVAALTIYDMCKSASHGIVIGETRLMEKTGGKSDFRAEGGAA